ncbi:MAG: hypothetical protein OZ921_16825 [Sorangiineae bacterium]|nr:hypothetical protein [Polyangiaceae bacterium]MEB2324179.1 hypothetical protein [Sorangiineae bacterium]
MTPLEHLYALALLPRAASLGPMLRALAALERLPTRELEHAQRARADELLEHARRTTGFYADAPARFEDLPPLSRATVQARASALASRAVPPEHRAVREAHSSGSTGTPVTVPVGAVADAILGALSMRDHGWHRRDLRAKAASIRASPDLRADAKWSLHPQGGPLVSLGMNATVREQLAWLEREAPAYLVTYASNAAALVEEAAEQGVALPSLRELGTFGETLPLELRETARRVWSVPVVDAYSSAEVGFIALECPEHAHYHVQAENVLVEVVRDDGTACETGETGRVLVTPLHSFPMPLLRYELGDFATVGGPCPTGLGLPVIERIVGRSRNMLTLPNGERSWPRFGSNLLGKLAPIRQFRMVQRGPEAMTLELVSERLTPELEARVRALVLELLGYPFELTFEYRTELPRSPGGKFEDFVALPRQP